MLRLQLDIVESYVPSGFDYEDVVYNLVNKLDSEGRIIELIEGACEQNQGNTYLRSLKQDIIPLIRLYQILNSFEEFLIDDIKKAYKQCCHQNWHVNSKRPFPDTLQKILSNLVDMPRGNTSNSSTEQFIVYLLVHTNNKLTPQQLEELNQLGDEHVNNFTDLLNETRVEIQETKEQKSQPTVPIPNSSPQKSPQFEFDVITVNRVGNEIQRERRQAEYFIEHLGNSISLEMVAIPGGKFMMGSPEGEGNHSEHPQHEVTVPSFFIGKYPITQAQWRVVAALPKIESDLKPNPSRFKGDNLPVECVSWYNIIEYCARLSQKTGRLYRLPSEAEWEYACRAGTKTPFHFGETITDKLANYNANYTFADESKGEYRQKTTPVGTFFPNAFGLYDMHGNVWEWCLDTYHDNYKEAPNDGSAWLNQKIGFDFGKLLNNALNFQNDNPNHPRLLRGGAWNLLPHFCRSAYRISVTPDNDNGIIGFRVVCGGAARIL
jgi:formylglycine-generating enzyme required for sulfatase activity